jgi:MFS family permease
MAGLHHHILAELGLISLYHSPIDTKILILQRYVRFFAFGGSTIVLALYLRALSISETRIGLFMSLALVGDVLSFILTLFADVVGRKLVLGGGALLMTLSGVVFGFTGNYWLLLVVSVVGVISPTYV